MKLKQNPHWSLLEVKLIFWKQHPLPYIWESPWVSNCVMGSGSHPGFPNVSWEEGVTLGFQMCNGRRELPWVSKWVMGGGSYPGFSNV